MNLNKSAEQTVVITDTTCLIILQKIEMLSILHQPFSVIITTPEVAAEYGGELPDWIDIVEVRDVHLKKELSLIVDEGEASTMTLAHEIENKFLITDDQDARKLAIKRGLRMIGSIGLILRAKENGLIDFVKPHIEKMRQTNFRASEDLYQTALRKAGEN